MSERAPPQPCFITDINIEILTHNIMKLLPGTQLLCSREREVRGDDEEEDIVFVYLPSSFARE